jgi:hypothetical protein
MSSLAPGDTTSVTVGSLSSGQEDSSRTALPHGEIPSPRGVLALEAYSSPTSQVCAVGS